MIHSIFLLNLALFLLTDSAGTVIDNASVTPLPACKKATPVATTSYDGLFTFEFKTNKDSARVRITAPGYDTLETILRKSPDGSVQRIYMRKAPFRPSRPSATTKGSTRGLSGSKMYKSEATDLVLEEAAETDVMYFAVAEDAPMPAHDHVVTGYGSVANSVKAGKLTAGEVNDFAKWYLWNNIIDGSHKEYVNNWQLYPKERYRVLVANKQQFPLADVPVELVDASGKVIFRGRTDNTGHAELWNNHTIGNTRQSASPAMIRCRHNDAILTLSSPALFPATNVFTVDAPCGMPDAVDVFFIVDATGSMGDELRYLKAEMIDVISRSGKAAPDAIIRTGALVYRDHGDDYINRISPLSDDITVTQRFLDLQNAEGGGDFPEAVPEALMATVNSAGWSANARARIAFLILDAPCHQDSTTIALLHKQIAAAAEKGIRIVPVVCSGLDKSGELLMRSLSLLTNGTSFFLTDDSGIGDKHLKPTTDSLKVEHLNDMLVRTIIEFSTMPECDDQWAENAIEEQPTDAFVPNPFAIEDLDSVPAILPVMPIEDVITVRPNPCNDYCLIDLPQGADALFLVDLSGKTIQSFGHMPTGTMQYSIDTSGYPTGIYLVKAFVGGRWYSKKIIKQG